MGLLAEGSGNFSPMAQLTDSDRISTELGQLSESSA